MNSYSHSTEEGHIVEFMYDGCFVQFITTGGRYIFRLTYGDEVYAEEVPVFLTIYQCITLVDSWKQV